MRVKVLAFERFHFWGTYSATIALLCESRGDAALVHALLLKGQGPLGALVDACGRACTSKGWCLHSTKAIVSLWASDQQLQTAHDQLARLGVDIKKLTSMAHSIDHGEPVTFSVDVPDPRQLELLLSYAPTGS